MTEELFVKDVMSRPVTIAKAAVITEALDKMLNEGIDPLIVMNNNSVVGTVSRFAFRSAGADGHGPNPSGRLCRHGRGRQPVADGVAQLCRI